MQKSSPRRGGRPIIPANEKKHPCYVSLTVEQRVKFHALGSSAWLQEMIEVAWRERRGAAMTKDEKRTCTIINHPLCPECGSSDTHIAPSNCPCCRTWEGATCWSAPECRACGHEGYANSDGIYWYSI